ncbi:MAG: sigma-70 family RNA polymerase sigma factor [Pirellulaceae bacterium]
MTTEVNALVNQCLAGHQTAFSDLIDRYRGMVYGLCLRMLRQREEAEDATQETFVRVCNNLHRWDPERSFEPWLLTIAGNRCRTRLAKRARRPSEVVLDYPVEDGTYLEAESRHLSEEIDAVLGMIKGDCKQAFVLFYKKRLSYIEIAEQLDIPLGTVKTWVHRARKELIARLANRGTIDVREKYMSAG